jgi:hypothetical protein
MKQITWRGRAALLGLVCCVASSPVLAQAWNYPSFHHPHTMAREFNFAVATGGSGAGTSLIFQWREGIGVGSEFTLDAGIADPGGDLSTRLLLGGGYSHRLMHAADGQPLDMLVTAGVYGALGDGPNLYRVPVGVTLGHRFDLEGDFAITPYTHPRVSVDFFDGDSELGINFDLGADFEMSPQLSLRFSAVFGSSDTFGRNADGFGLSVAYKPGGIRRR